eukprot:TRINITY_DN16254_c0_g1_i1.p1 TRINITY_DN16254_c0_g1~~TRINITY_DN16254_c0_g1_i1.p1  ORF type:complete len:74 (-),score=8.83 TRINITY_DN16254_c0_g1_i1:174-395(-)
MSQYSNLSPVRFGNFFVEVPICLLYFLKNMGREMFMQRFRAQDRTFCILDQTFADGFLTHREREIARNHWGFL